MDPKPLELRVWKKVTLGKQTSYEAYLKQLSSVDIQLGALAQWKYEEALYSANPFEISLALLQKRDFGQNRQRRFPSYEAFLGSLLRRGAAICPAEVALALAMELVDDETVYTDSRRVLYVATEAACGTIPMISLSRGNHGGCRVEGIGVDNGGRYFVHDETVVMIPRRLQETKRFKDDEISRQ